MKKLFTLFAALCCMVGVARAACPDGVKIAVQGDEVTGFDYRNITAGGYVKSGHVSYDPTYHTLYLVDAVIDANIANGLTITMPDNADFKVTILLGGTSSSTISTSAALSHGLSIYGNVEIRGFNHKLVCSSTSSGIAGIYLGEGSSLTITGGVSVEATGINYGVRGSGADKSTLKIDSGYLKAYSSTNNTSSTDYACVGGVDLKLNGSQIIVPDGATYDASKNGSIVKSGAYVTKQIVEITQLNDLLYVYPQNTYSVYEDLSQRLGSYALTKGGAAQSNPAPHMSGDEFAASLTAGPEAKQWEATSVYNASSGYTWTGDDVSSGKVNVTSSAMTRAYLAGLFRKKVAFQSKMYMANNDGSVNLYETTDFKELPGMPAMPSAIDDNVTCMTYANNGTDGAGNLYFAKEDGSKVGIYRIDWKNYSSSTPEEVVKDQSDYYPFADLSYNWANGYLYGIAKKTSDSKWYLVQVQISTSKIVQIGELNATSASNPPLALACDNYGALYCMVYKKYDPRLYRVDAASGSMSLYSHVGYTNDLVNTIFGITTANMYKYHSMQFDYKTNKLYWWFYTSNQGNTVQEIDMSMGHGDVVTINFSGSNVTNNLGMFQELPKSYTITAKVKDGPTGKAYVNGVSSVMALEGTEVELTAEGNATEGTEFKQWSDGNKDNPRTVKVTKDAEYIAEFYYGEGVKDYPVWINGKQMHDKRLVFNSSNMSGKITAGEIKYDPENRTLLFDKLTMGISGSDLAVLIGQTGSSTELTIKVKGGDAKISGTDANARPMKIVNASVKIVGDKSLTLSANPAGVILSDGSTLTLEGITATLKGSYAVNAYDNDRLVIRGSKVTLNGSTKVTNGLGEVTWQYCKTDPSNAYYNTTDKKFTKGEGGAALADVSFSVDGFTVRCTPAEEGTGIFSIRLSDGTGETFENVGWFKSGAKVTISPYGADNYGFGYWTDDVEKEATREFTISADLTKEVRFFRQVQSNATWYGVHDGKVASFTLYDFGKNVVNPKKAAAVSGVNGGDYCNGQWYLAESSSIKTWSFGGNFDKETELDTKTTAYVTVGVPSGLTDYAYSIMGGEHYGVAAKELYQINLVDKKMEKIGAMKNKYTEGGVEKEKDVSGIGIAFDAAGMLYVLGADGALYTLGNIDTEKKEVWLNIVGDAKNGGSIHETVNSGAQSLAFDHVTGELFWAGKDFIRQIDLSAMKCYKVADLGFKKGSAGVVKAMHRMDMLSYVKAQVADSCSEMGAVSVDGAKAALKSDGYFIEGASVSITAVPAEGYKFSRWTRLEGKKEIDMKKDAEKNPYEFPAFDAVFVAYFEAIGEGIDEVNSEEMTVEKVMINGQIYIIKGNTIYTITGNRVK